MARGREEHWDTASNREAETGLGEGNALNPDGTPDWLKMARSSFQASTNWLNANLRNQWERNLRTFNNRHPSGS